MKRIVKNPASVFAISLAEAKAQCVVEYDDDDILLSSIIESAQDYCEQYLGFPLTETVYTYFFDCFAASMPIETPNIKSVVVTYDDADNVSQTLASTEYHLDQYTKPAILYPVNTWPTTYDKPNAVQIDVIAGETDATLIPGAIKSAMLLLIGHLYRNREAEIVGAPSKNLELGVEQFLNKYRVPLC